MDRISPLVEEKIQQWKNDLSDKSKSNPLINFRENPKKNLRLEMTASELFDQLLNKKNSSINLTSLVENNSEFKSKLKTARYLRREADQIKKNKGVDNLFVSIGYLTWNSKDTPNSPMSSPLFLIPVELQKVKGEDDYVLYSMDEDFIVNPDLTRKLEQEYNIRLEDFSDSSDLTWEFFTSQFEQFVSEKNGWKIEQTSYLSIFQQRKASMLRDLEEYENLINEHPILRGLANEIKLNETDENTKYSDPMLDEQDSESVFQVLDADSSQQIIIEKAKSGLSFITQVPPGTGKSQTIVNIVSELVSEGKTILLIAEKTGALDVVYRNLKKCQLQDLCLPFHRSEYSSKKQFSKSLKSETRNLPSLDKPQSDFFFRNLDRNRTALNEYRNSIHKYWPAIKYSTFDIYNELILLSRKGIPDLKANISNIEYWSIDHLFEAKDQLEKLGSFSKLFRDEETTFWKRSSVKTLSYREKSDIEEGISLLKRNIKNLEKASGNIQNLLEVSIVDDTLRGNRFCCSAVNVILNSPSLLPSGWQNSSLEELNDELSSLRYAYKSLCEQHEKIKNTYTPEIFSLDLLKIARKFRNKYKSLFRIFHRSYWQDCKNIFALRRAPQGIHFLYMVLFSPEKIIRDLEDVERYKTLKEYIFSPGSSKFSSYFKNEEINFGGIDNSITWIENLQKYSLNKKRVAEVIENVHLSESLAKQRDELNTSEELIRIGFDFLLSLFPEKELRWLFQYESLDSTSLSKTLAFLEKAEQELDIFQRWTYCQGYIDNLERMGVKTFLNSLKESYLEPNLWFDAFKKAILLRWLGHIYDSYPELRVFNSKIHENKVEEFATQDREQCTLARKRLRKLYSDRWKKWSEQTDSITQLSILNREASKQSSHKSIRDLIKEIKELVVVLKPCWLMSPTVASENIDPEAMKFGN